MQAGRIGLAILISVSSIPVTGLSLPARSMIVLGKVRFAVRSCVLLSEQLLLSLSRASPSDLNVVGTRERSLCTVATGRTDCITSIEESQVRF